MSFDFNYLLSPRISQISVISALAFSRRRSCQISVIFRLITIFLSGVTAKQSVLRLHRRENRLRMLGITEIWQLRRRENPKAEIAVIYLSFIIS